MERGDFLPRFEVSGFKINADQRGGHCVGLRQDVVSRMTPTHDRERKVCRDHLRLATGGGQDYQPAVAIHARDAPAVSRYLGMGQIHSTAQSHWLTAVE